MPIMVTIDIYHGWYNVKVTNSICINPKVTKGCTDTFSVVSTFTEKFHQVISSLFEQNLLS
jgi:hypothetical protein